MIYKVIQILSSHGITEGNYQLGEFGREAKTKTILLKTAPSDALVSDLKAQLPDWTFTFGLMGAS